MEKYFVIYQPGCHCHVSEYTKEKLIKALEEGDFGPQPNFLKVITDSDPATWGEEGFLIIKGEIKIPEVKTVAKIFDV